MNTMKTIPSELGFLGVMPLWRFQGLRAADFPTQRVCVDLGDGKFSEYWSNGESWLASAQWSGDSLTGADNTVFALANNGQPGTTLSATGTGYNAPCEFWGIEISAYSGGPQTVVVRNGGAGGTIVGNAASTRSMVRAVSTVGWTLKNSLLVQAAGDANPIITTSAANPAAGAVDGNYYWLADSGAAAFDGGAFAAWQAAHGIDAASTASAASPLVTASYVPLPGSPLLTGGADLGSRRDIRGFQSRKHIGAYGAATVRRV